MGGTHGARKLSKDLRLKKRFEPEVFIDRGADFASIKIAPGIEVKSYIKDGILFSEDKSGKIIEIQVLNLSSLK